MHLLLAFLIERHLNPRKRMLFVSNFAGSFCWNFECEPDPSRPSHKCISPGKSEGCKYGMSSSNS